MKNISIIGVGLIGGSIGLALKKLKVKGQRLKVIGIGRNFKRLKIAKKLSVVDEITTDIKEGVKDADIIFVCLPVGLIAETVKKIIPYCKRGAIITDVGSVKNPIISEVEKFLSPFTFHLSPVFIGGHPIAGSEKTSVKYASSVLFKNAVVVLTPTKKTDKKALEVIKKLWGSFGAKVRIMSPEKHDEILSFTSHLPHVLSFSLVNSVENLEFTGTGFKDTTRIASSDPEMWSDIIFNNRTNVRSAIRKFKKELSKIENAKTEKDLLKIFKKAKLRRDNLYKKVNKKKVKEKKLIEFIRESLKRRKSPPTVREIAKFFNISISVAHKYLQRLYDKNLLSKRVSQISNRTVARGFNIK